MSQAVPVASHRRRDWSWRSQASAGWSTSWSRSRWSRSASGSSRTTRWRTCGCAASRAASTSCAARRLRHRRERCSPTTRSTPTGRRSWSAWPTRCAWRSSASSSRPSSARCSASAASRATRWCAASATRYVELFRNIPVLLQLLMWYLVFTELLPARSSRSALRPVLPQQGRIPVPGTGVGPGPGTGSHWRAGRLRGRPVVPALGAAQIRTDRARAQHVLGAAGDRRRCRLAGLGPGRRADRVEHAASARRLGRRRRRGDAGVPRGAARPGALHLGLHRRGGARRHPVGLARAGRGGQQPGSAPRRRCAW